MTHLNDLPLDKTSNISASYWILFPLYVAMTLSPALKLTFWIWKQEKEKTYIISLDKSK